MVGKTANPSLRLLGKGIAGVPAGTWLVIALAATALSVASLRGAVGGVVNWLFVVIASVSAVVAALAFAAWLWTGPVLVPLRAHRIQRRLAAEREEKQTAALPSFEEAFRGWPEFRQLTATMLDVLSREEDRMAGHKREGPGWSEFVRAAAAARIAAESIWKPWRAEALASMEPLAALREPIDFKLATTSSERLKGFLQLDLEPMRPGSNRDQHLMNLAGAAGIDPQEFVRRLKEPSAS